MVEDGVVENPTALDLLFDKAARKLEKTSDIQILFEELQAVKTTLDDCKAGIALNFSVEGDKVMASDGFSIVVRANGEDVKTITVGRSKEGDAREFPIEVTIYGPGDINKGYSETYNLDGAKDAVVNSIFPLLTPADLLRLNQRQASLQKVKENVSNRESIAPQ